MLGLLRSKTAAREASGPEPARSVEERRRVLAAITAEEALVAERLRRLDEQAVLAREREARAQELLEAARQHRAEIEAEQLVASTAGERRSAWLRWQLTAGAPAELEELATNVALLVEAARLRSETRLADGYQGIDGRHQVLTSTNTGAITALIQTAGRVIGELLAEQQAESPRVERFAPFVEVSLPGALLEPAQRPGDSGGLVPRVVVVPVELAEMWVGIGGVASPKSMLTPGEARFLEADAETRNQKRWNAGAWR